MEISLKHQELYKIAIEVFAQYGYRKATVEDIADRMGLTKSAIYQYVKSKKELYEEALRSQMHEWHACVIAVMDEEGDFTEQFAKLCKEAFMYLNKNKSFKKILAEDPKVFPMSFHLDPYKEINVKSMNCLERFITKGIKQGILREIDAQIAAQFVFSTYKMVIVTTYSLDSCDEEKIINVAIEIITRGIYK